MIDTQSQNKTKNSYPCENHQGPRSRRDLQQECMISPALATIACDKTKCSLLGSDFYEEAEMVTRGIAFDCDGVARVRKHVAIFADYDGCFDIISDSNVDGAKMDKMFDYAKQIGRLIYPKSHAQQILIDFLDKITAGADEVFLFSGSNRQSREADESNAVQNDNGLSMTGLKKLSEDRKWHFESRLLEDAGINPNSVMNGVKGSSEIKKLLAENNFKLLTEQTEVYFIDDIEKYLKYTREKAKIPENIDFKTVQFDWYGICIEGTQAGDRPLLPISANQ